MTESVQIVIEAKDAATAIIKTISAALSGDLSAAATAAGLAITVGLGAAIATLKELAMAGGEQEDTMMRFNTIVSNSKLGDYKDQMLALADAYSKKTKFENDSIISAETTLSLYDTISKEALPSVLKQTLNLAEFMHSDATEAAQTLGRAFSDIAGGSLTLLYRQKLITQEQKDQAEAMAKNNDVAGAQALVIDSLSKKFGNLAENAGATLTGRMAIFGNTIHDIAENIGTQLLPVLEPLLQKLTDLALKYAPMLADVFENYVIPAVSELADGFSKLLDTLDSGKLLDFFKNIDWKAASESLAAGIDNIDFSAVGDKLRIGVGGLATYLYDALTNIDWMALGFSIANALDEFLAGLTGQGSVQNVINQWTNNITMAIQIGWNLIGLGITKAHEFAQAIYTGLGNSIGLIIGAINSWIGPIVGVLDNIKKAFFAAFLGAGQQAIAALNNIKGRVMAELQKFMDALLAIVKGGITISINIPMPNWGAIIQQIQQGIARVQNAIGGGGNLNAAGAGGGNKPLPHKAAGGSVNAGETYLVGEEGMELFTPKQSGTIIPNNRIGGGESYVLNLNYAPIFSTADRAELIAVLTPMLNDWYRRRNQS